MKNYPTAFGWANKMNFILDTHTFIWLDTEPERLSQTALRVCENQDNQLYLSMVSVWEMQIKNQLGKLNLRLPIAEMIAVQQQENDLKLLPIQLEQIYQLNNLPLYHNDPFDRLLLAQALQENMAIISVDSKFSHYDNVRIIW